MALATNIARRAGSARYYARVRVPLDVQPLLPRAASGKLKAELWESLDTSDPREARARALPVLQRWSRQFDDLRRRREASEDDVRDAAWQHYREEAARNAAERRTVPTQADIQVATGDLQRRIADDEVAWPDDELGRLNAVIDLLVMKDAGKLQRETRQRRLATLLDHVGRGETALIEWAADEVISREALAVERGSSAYRDLCQRLQRAEIEALRRAEEQDRGDFGGDVRDEGIKPAHRPAATVAAPGESVMELFDVYARENHRRVKPDTLRTNREIMEWFVQSVGPRFPASAIDKRAVRDWKQALADFPIKAAEVKEFRGLGFKEIIAANATLKRPTLSDKSINKYLSALGAFSQWLFQHDYIPLNPVRGLHLSIDKDQQRVRPYTTSELKAIFASPLFAGSASADDPHRPGKVRVRDGRYWLPLLALFTGARMGELAQLLVADVREERGRWIIHVTREGDAAKTTKNKGSQRVIPVHPELVRLGFISFHAQRMALVEPRLFPEIMPDSRGQLAGTFSRFFNRYVARIGVKADKAVNFHSFRHGMADAFRRAGYRDEEFAFMLGHTGATTTGRYGILSEGELMKRCTMIDAVSFPGLDLSKLHT